MDFYSSNEPLSKYSTKLLQSYIKFPENEPYTVVDYRGRDGAFMDQLTTKSVGNRYVYAASKEKYLADDYRSLPGVQQVSQSHYKNESRISKEAFSMAIIDAEITRPMIDEIFNSYEDLVEPDFEAIERKKYENLESKIDTDQIDFNNLDETEEEAEEERKEKIEKEIAKVVKQKKVAFRAALKEKEKRITFQRSDNFLLAKATEQLMPGGVLVLITPKEMIDTAVTLRLGNQYENIRILRTEDDEYVEGHKCIILANRKMRRNGQIDRAKGFELAETRLQSYKNIDLLTIESEPSFIVPSKDPEDVEMFRIGPITAAEAEVALNRSSLLENYQESYSQVLNEENPVAPTALHKGHMMLLLTSGSLNGYIGKGVNQHLVKGSAIKRTRETVEEDEEGNATTKTKDFYDITVRYLDNTGSFHKLM